MKRIAVAAALLLGGCTWSNSLYQARLLTRNAQAAEREGRPGDAQPLWGQAAFKAESAFARSPRGRRGTEALWLAGHAQVRLNDCQRGLPRLEQALIAGPDPKWHDELLVEIADCQSTIDPTRAAITYARLTETAVDTVVRHRSRLRYAHLLLVNGDWAGSIRELGALDTLPARLDRATALVHLGDGGASLAQLRSSLAPLDTTVAWSTFVDLFSQNVPLYADSLLQALLASNRVPPARGSDWLLAAATATLESEPRLSDHWLALLVARPAGRSVLDGRTRQVEMFLRRSPSIAVLAERLDSADRAGANQSIVGANFETLVEDAHRLVARAARSRPPAPDGAIAEFALAEFARDSLLLPVISRELLARLEHEWPTSPYAGKGILARILIDQDSAAALRVRAAALGKNPYIAQASGDIAARLGFARLEDSLARFMRTPWLPIVAGRTRVANEE